MPIGYRFQARPPGFEPGHSPGEIRELYPLSYGRKEGGEDGVKAPPPVGLSGRALASNWTPGPSPHLIGVTRFCGSRIRLSDPGKHKRGGQLAPSRRSVHRPATGQANEPPGPGSVHCETFGLAFIRFACDWLSTPFAVGPGEAGVGCFYSGITWSATVERGSDANWPRTDEGPPKARATLRQIPSEVTKEGA